MKEIVTQHPLRAIILEFDPEKPTLDFETKALEAYTALHGRSDKVYRRAEVLNDHINKLFG